MSARNEVVDQFMRELEHPRKAEIEYLRQVLLACDSEVTEHVKWNAPSFRFRGDDRVTFRLQPKNRVQLVFHRGVKVKDTEHFGFEDEEGLLEWVSADRAVVTFQDSHDVELKADAVARLASAWMQATSE